MSSRYLEAKERARAYLPEIEVNGEKAYGIAVVGNKAYVLKLGRVRKEDLKEILRVDEVIEIAGEDLNA